MEPITTPKIQTRLEVKYDANGGPAKLYLYGTIRKAYPWEDGSNCISSAGVMNSLANLKGIDLDVHLNSGGGDVFESIAIRNLLLQHNGTVNAYIDGLAGSGGSVIPTGCKEVFMFVGSMQMIHNASADIFGNAKELRKAADDLDKISNSAKQNYMSKFVGTEAELDQLLDENTWLSAEECLAFGLCTKILDAPNEQDPIPPQAKVKESLFAKYQKEPPKIETPAPSVKETLFKKFKSKV